jgi:hypothetical protein
MLPFFDADTNMLYLAGKGDTNIRYFEIDDEPPYQHFVNQFIGKEPQRGCAFVPKKGLDTGNCEIMRFLRLTQNAVEPVSFTVPRKGDHFQPDLYPDTFAGRASLKSAEWFAGKNAQPMLMSLNPRDAGSAVRAVVRDDSTAITGGGGGGGGGGGSSSSSSVAPGGGGGGGGGGGADPAVVKQLESKVAGLEEENRRLRAAAEEAVQLKAVVQDLQAKNDRLERQIAKMG